MVKNLLIARKTCRPMKGVDMFIILKKIIYFWTTGFVWLFLKNNKHVHTFHRPTCFPGNQSININIYIYIYITALSLIQSKQCAGWDFIVLLETSSSRILKWFSHSLSTLLLISSCIKLHRRKRLEKPSFFYLDLQSTECLLFCGSSIIWQTIETTLMANRVWSFWQHLIYCYFQSLVRINANPVTPKLPDDILNIEHCQLV